ncbi:unnamed protein product [Chrysoparadoxa australica]
MDRMHFFLREWAPGKYTKRYLSKLVALCHFTLKILDKKKDELGLSVCRKDMVHAMRDFHFDYYFTKMATATTVRLYTTMLEDYAGLSPRTLHYVIGFFTRLTETKVGSTHKKRKSGDDDASEGEIVSLEAMMYNGYTLMAMEKLLNDPMTRASEYARAVKFIRSVILKFGRLAAQNHMVFVEVLASHTHPMSFIRELHNGYCGQDERRAVEELMRPPPLPGSTPLKKPKTTSSSIRLDEGSDEEAEPEFDDSVATQGATNRKGAATGRGVTALRESDEEDGYNSYQPSEDGNDSSSEEEEDTWAGNVPRAKPGKKKKTKQTGKSAGGKPVRWNTKEDTLLRLQYAKYKDSASAFMVLAELDGLERHSPQDIERRVKYLKLGQAETTYSDTSSSSDDSDGSSDGEQVKSKVASKVKSSTKGPAPDATKGPAPDVTKLAPSFSAQVPPKTSLKKVGGTPAKKAFNSDDGSSDEDLSFGAPALGGGRRVIDDSDSD